MNSGASWNERGLSPELYQAAREAAMRAGMPVEDWLSATSGKSAPAPARPTTSDDEPRFHASATPPRGGRLSDTVAALNARLEQMASGRTAAAANPEPAPRAAPPAPPPPVEEERSID